MAIRVTITVGRNYTVDLKARLKRAKITHGQLARAMEINPTQLSRWFNRPMALRMDSVERIERAILQILKDRERDHRSTASA